VPPVPMRSFPLGNVGDGPLPNFADLSGGIAGVRLVADAGAPAAGSPEVTKQSAQLSLQILQQRSDEFTKALEQCQLELDQSKDTTAFLNCASDALSAYGDDLDDPLIQLPPELAGTVSVIRETVQRIRTANSDSDRQAALTEARAAVRDLVDFVKKQTELVSAVDPETEAVLKQHGQVMTEALEKMDLAMVSAVEI
ncbi:MAG TPA: hypothetical protein VL147_22595, partial [Devosia sp.]|nr:hypothetical protein [Devosia sp.]